MEVLVTICCRRGSKGVKGKNIRLMHGKPLVQHTINHALEWELQCKVPMSIVVTTDDAEVRRIAVKNNLFVIDRDPELCGDRIGKVAVVRDAWRQMEHRLNRIFDITLDLDVCNPMRRIEDIEAVYQLMVKENPPTVFSVTKARRNPHFNMWPLLGGGPLRRQDCPDVFDLNCNVYGYSRQFLLSEKQSVITDRSAIHVMPDWSFCDVDSELDFFIVEQLMERYAQELGQAPY